MFFGFCFFLSQMGTKFSQHNVITHILLSCHLIFWVLRVLCLLWMQVLCHIFLRAKVFHFMKFNLSTWWIVLLVSYARTLCPTYTFSPIFSSRHLKILDLSVRSMILFELIFVFSVKYRLAFIFWHVAIWDHLLERLYLHLIAFVLLLKISWSDLHGFISGFFILDMSFFLILHYLDYCSFIVILEITLWEIPN